MNHCLQPTTASNCHVVSRVPYSLKVLKASKSGKKKKHLSAKIISYSTLHFEHPTVDSHSTFLP